jgi:hypothetical protein
MHDGVNTLQVPQKMVSACESATTFIDMAALVLAHLVYGFHVTIQISA